MWAFVTYYTVLSNSKKIDRLVTRYLLRGLLCSIAGVFIGQKMQRRKKKQSIDSQNSDTPATLDTPLTNGSSDERI
jgi:hypothetical protein